MCTVKSDSEVMVCDVSWDRVRELLLERIGDAAEFETIDGEGTGPGGKRVSARR